MAHTPTPWRADIGQMDNDLGPYIRSYVGPDGKTIAVNGFAMTLSQGGRDEAEANAAFIVLAVNSHDALVEALKSMCGAFDTPIARRQIDTDFANEARTAARAALALATPAPGETP